MIQHLVQDRTAVIVELNIDSQDQHRARPIERQSRQLHRILLRNHHSLTRVLFDQGGSALQMDLHEVVMIRKNEVMLHVGAELADRLLERRGIPNSTQAEHALITEILSVRKRRSIQIAKIQGTMAAPNAGDVRCFSC